MSNSVVAVNVDSLIIDPGMGTGRIRRSFYQTTRKFYYFFKLGRFYLSKFGFLSDRSSVSFNNKPYGYHDSGRLRSDTAIGVLVRPSSHGKRRRLVAASAIGSSDAAAGGLRNAELSTRAFIETPADQLDALDSLLSFFSE